MMSNYCLLLKKLPPFTIFVVAATKIFRQGPNKINSFKDQSIVRNYNSKFLYRHEGIQLLQTYFVAIFQVKVHTRLIFQILGYGILFRVSEENIAAHRNDRKIRIFDESNIIQVSFKRWKSKLILGKLYI